MRTSDSTNADLRVSGESLAPTPILARPVPVQLASKGSMFSQLLRTTDPKVIGRMYLVTPLVFAFANHVLPLQIGSSDVAFPRLNAFSTGSTSSAPSTRWSARSREGREAMMSNGHIDVARIYDRRSQNGGYRVLIDRVWPRGLSRGAAGLDEWCRDVAPSTELRQWYGHRPERFTEFRERYLVELDDADHAEAVAHLRDVSRHDRMWLLTATKDLCLSHARVLAEGLSWGRATSEPTVSSVHINQPREA